jgi:hypothetical protein
MQGRLSGTPFTSGVSLLAFCWYRSTNVDAVLMQGRLSGTPFTSGVKLRLHQVLSLLALLVLRLLALLVQKNKC